MNNLTYILNYYLGEKYIFNYESFMKIHVPSMQAKGAETNKQT